MPPVGQAQAQLAVGRWCLAWASQASPHHFNQDCAGVRWLPTTGAPWPTLAVALADGVTLAAEGAVAAHSLVGYWLAQAPPADDTVRAAWLAGADEHVSQALKAITAEPGAATGAATWLQADGSAWATRVGDCRVLLARCEVRPQGQDSAGNVAHTAAAWSVHSLFTDQTLGAAHPDLFPDPQHPQAGQPAQFVGCQRLGAPEAKRLQVQPGELLMLASDGLHASFSDADWRRVLSAHLGQGLQPNGAGSAFSPESLQALCNDLIQTAQQLGSEDDITALAVAHNPGGEL